MDRVLVIDDERDMRDVLRMALEIHGYAVLDAGDGREGLELFAQEPFDLVITDIIMPGRDGLETIREIRNRDAQVKIIAISGDRRLLPAGVRLPTAMTFGADLTLRKPFSLEDMLGAVQQLLPPSAELPPVRMASGL